MFLLAGFDPVAVREEIPRQRELDFFGGSRSVCTLDQRTRLDHGDDDDDVRGAGTAGR